MELTCQAHKPFIDQLKAIQETIDEWEREKSKIIAQLKSLQNLQEQLEAIDRCVSAGNTGVLSGYPAVLNRLQGKIIGSKERAMQFIERDRKSMSRLGSLVQNKGRQIETLLQESIGQYGLEAVVRRTAERFSLCDYAKWAEEMRYILYCDWQEMRDVLMRMDQDAGCVCDVWASGGSRLQEFQRLISDVCSGLVQT